MKNTIRVFCLLSVCLGLSACSDEYSQKTFKSFEEICLFSNGTFENEVCNCGGKECDYGVVCENGKCANKTEKDIIVEVRCEDNTTRCKDGVTQKCIGGNWGEDKICGDLGCAKDGLSCAECEGDEKKCDNNILKSCFKERWIESICQFGCFDNNACTECQNDTIRCKDGNRERCEGQRWVEYSCNNGLNCYKGECIEAECLEDGDEICIDGKWKICSQKKLIFNPDKECVSKVCNGEVCAECNGEDTECINGEIKSCLNNIWSDKRVCSGSYSCKSEKECGDCKNGSTKCESNQFFTCSDGGWGDGIPCDNGCDENGHCKTDGDITEQKCSYNGLKCKEDPVEVGKYFIYTCQDGQEIKGDECKNGCDGNQCKSEVVVNGCQEGEVKCISDMNVGKIIGKINVCKNENGSFGFIPTNIDCEQCENGETQCFDFGNKSVTYNCQKDGTLKVRQECEGVSCNADGTACGVCKNDNKQCTGEIGHELFQMCVDGQWNNGTPCPGGCNYATECNETCKENEKKKSVCMNDDKGVANVYECDGEKWDNILTCQDGCNKAGTACHECETGTKKCVGNVFKSCVDENWVNETCGDNQTCDATKGCISPSCDNEKDDIGHVYGILTSGSWPDNICPGGCNDDRSGCNNSCSKSVVDRERTKCISNGDESVMFECKGTVWGLPLTCIYGCKNNKCADCIGEVESSSCDDDNEEKIGYIRYSKNCDNGDTLVGKTTECKSYGNKVSCKNESECGVCKNGETNGIVIPQLDKKCDDINGSPLKCDLGQWVNNGCVNEFNDDDIYVCKHGDGYYGGRDVIYMYGKTNENWDGKNKFWNITVCKVDEHCEETFDGKVSLCIKN